MYFVLQANTHEHVLKHNHKSFISPRHTYCIIFKHVHILYAYVYCVQCTHRVGLCFIFTRLCMFHNIQIVINLHDVVAKRT